VVGQFAAMRLDAARRQGASAFVGPRQAQHRVARPLEFGGDRGSHVTGRAGQK